MDDVFIKKLFFFFMNFDKNELKNGQAKGKKNRIFIQKEKKKAEAETNSF